MIKYDSSEFIKRLTDRINNHEYPNCPYCGGEVFTATENYAAVFIDKDFSNFSIGQNIPAGMVICEKCGHIELFALGALGLIPKKEE